MEKQRFPPYLSHNKIGETASQITSRMKPKNRASYWNGLNRFIALYPQIRVSEITDHHAQAFRKSLDGLSPNTINHYIGYMRTILNHAIREGRVQKNPFIWIGKERVSTNREFLTISELRRLEAARCNTDTQEAVRRAFLFSCYTGLRLGDIYKLKNTMIKDGVLTMTISKTKTPLKLKLPKMAIKLPFSHQATSFPTLRFIAPGIHLRPC